MAFPKEKFTLTEKHILLVTEMFVDWDSGEFGAPCIDPKRPYGNGDVIDDIIRILDIDVLTDEDDYNIVSDDLHEHLSTLHEETQIALQIILRTQSFVPGDYECEPYDGKQWELVS